MAIIEQIKAEVERLKIQEPQSAEADGYNMAIADVLSIIEESRAPEPFFYCKYGGTIPKCSDCKRNHSNSKYKTEEIHNWCSPEMRGTKMCSCYVPIEKSSNDLEEAADEFWQNSPDKGIYDEYSPFYKDGFIAGAEWQREQDDKDLSEKIAAAYKLGLADKEKQMMKDAVEGEIFDDYDKDTCEHHLTILSTVPSGYKDGDKVRIVVCKKED